MEIVELLSKKGANAKIQDKWGYSPIHTAAARGFQDIIKALLNKSITNHNKYNGGDNSCNHKCPLNNDLVNSRDRQGKTPLHQAVINNKIPIIEYLIK